MPLRGFLSSQELEKSPCPFSLRGVTPRNGHPCRMWLSYNWVCVCRESRDSQVNNDLKAVLSGWYMLCVSFPIAINAEISVEKQSLAPYRASQTTGNFTIGQGNKF